MPGALRRSAVWNDPRTKPRYGQGSVNVGHSLGHELVGCWLCQEEGGSQLEDLSRSQLPLTFAGASLAWALGQSGKALNTLGAAGAYRDSGNTLLDFSGDHSLVLLMKPNSVTGTVTIFMKQSPGDSVQYAINMESGVIKLYMVDMSPYNIVSGATTLTVNRWWHVVTTFSINSNTAKIYINGKQDGSATGTGTFTTEGDTPFAIGGFRTGSASWLQVADICIEAAWVYRRALTPTEVAWLAVEPYAMLQARLTRRLDLLATGRTTKNTRSFPLGMQQGLGWQLPFGQRVA